ncbi:hypothetical protein E2C01_059827 [Portunus trituberculatus]|uniref:Uncharacterized protein n=1 Tax=Portunus trituberculatus TaxID=210409 RepID=A0A5B7GZG9_PORTR|nr:hypothetical protein [Portunus trituberculatus]
MDNLQGTCTKAPHATTTTTTHIQPLHFHIITIPSPNKHPNTHHHHNHKHISLPTTQQAAHTGRTHPHHLLLRHIPCRTQGTRATTMCPGRLDRDALQHNYEPPCNKRAQHNTAKEPHHARHARCSTTNGARCSKTSGPRRVRSIGRWWMGAREGGRRRWGDGEKGEGRTEEEEGGRESLYPKPGDQCGKKRKASQEKTTRSRESREEWT